MWRNLNTQYGAKIRGISQKNNAGELKQSPQNMQHAAISIGNAMQELHFHDPNVTAKWPECDPGNASLARKEHLAMRGLCLHLGDGEY